MKPMTRLFALLMTLCLLIPFAPVFSESAAPAEEMTEPAAEETPAEDMAPAEETAPDEAAPAAVTAPEGFEFLKAAKGNVNKYLTALRIPGVEPTVYAYLDKSGAVIYLVYGRLEKKKGMYEAELSSSEVNGERVFELNIIGAAPHRGIEKNLGRPKGVALNAATLPEGYRKTSKKGVCYFTNIFGVKEYRVLGRLSGRGDSYYPAQYGKPRPGGLPIDISKDSERFLEKGAKKQKLPREYKNGFATAVLVLTKQAEWVSVLTDKPVLNLEKK